MENVKFRLLHVKLQNSFFKINKHMRCQYTVLQFDTCLIDKFLIYIFKTNEKMNISCTSPGVMLVFYLIFFSKVFTFLHVVSLTVKLIVKRLRTKKFIFINCFLKVGNKFLQRFLDKMFDRLEICSCYVFTYSKSLYYLRRLKSIL